MNKKILLILLLGACALTNSSAQNIFSDKVLMGYWHNWGPELRLIDIPEEYNLIVIAFATPTDDKGLYSFTPYYDVNLFKQDVADVQAEGRKVIISLGGGGITSILHTTQDKDNFVATVKAIVETYGFDGIDIDFEGESIYELGDENFKNPTNTNTINLHNGIDELLTYFGDEFLLTAAPETYYVQYGYQGIIADPADPEGKLKGSFFPFLHRYHDRIDYLAVQLYNSGEAWMLDNKAYPVGDPSGVAAFTHMLLHGIPVGGHNLGSYDGLEWIEAFKPEQILVGIPSSYSAATGGFIFDGELDKALDALYMGKSSPITYKEIPGGGYPAMGGVMTWSINWDQTDNAYGFANHLSSYYANLTSLGVESDDELVLGTIDATRTISKTYTITNYTTSTQPITITNINPELTISSTSFDLDPGHTKTLEVEASFATEGVFAGSFDINYGATTETINVTATVECLTHRGFTHDFSGSGALTNWSSTSEQILESEDERLKVTANKTNTYDNFRYSFAQVNLEQQSTLSFDLESDNDLALRIDLADINDNATNKSPLMVQYQGGSGLKHYTLNFENNFEQSWPNNAIVNSQAISALHIYPEPGNTYTGVFYIDNIELGMQGSPSYSAAAAYCPGQPYNWEGQELWSQGVYSKLFSNIQGCDSLVYLTLTENEIYDITTERSICEGQSFSFGNNMLTQAGTYMETLTSTIGCDSLVNLTLHVNPVFNQDETKEVCEGQSFAFGTQILTETGSYTEVFQSVLGCDSTVVLTFTAHPVYDISTTESICEGSTFTFGDQELTAEGNYQHLYQTVYGCDSLVNLTLNTFANTLDAGLTNSEGILEANEPNAAYQWIDCATQQNIPDATQKRFIPTEPGSYAVWVSKNGCAIQTECQQVDVVLGLRAEQNGKVQIYPNPVTSEAKVSFTQPQTGYCNLIQANGKLLCSTSFKQQAELSIDMQQEMPGLYLLQIQFLDGTNAILKIKKK